MDKNELSDPPVAKQLQALNTDLPNHTHYAIAIIIVLEGNEITEASTSNMAFNFIQRKCTIKRRWREITKSQ